MMNEERLLGENAVTFLKNLSVRGRPLRMRLWPNFGARNGARMTRKKIWGSHTSLRQPKEGDNGGGVGKYIPSQIIQIMVIFFCIQRGPKVSGVEPNQAGLPPLQPVLAMPAWQSIVSRCLAISTKQGFS